MSLVDHKKVLEEDRKIYLNQLKERKLVYKVQQLIVDYKAQNFEKLEEMVSSASCGLFTTLVKKVCQKCCEGKIDEYTVLDLLRGL